jgi:hypothetical protein
MKTERFVDLIIVATSIAIGAGRFGITPRLELPTAEGSYEAVAHMFVGGLFGAWAVKPTKWLWLAMAVAISLVELAMFIIQKSSS